MIDRNQMALHMAAAQFAITTLLPDNINTIHHVVVDGDIPRIIVSNRRKPTKKEKRLCRKLLYLTPITGGMLCDEWVGYTPSVYGIPVELRWKCVRKGEMKKALTRLIAHTAALVAEDDIEWTGDDDDDVFGMLGVM